MKEGGTVDGRDGGKKDSVSSYIYSRHLLRTLMETVLLYVILTELACWQDQRGDLLAELLLPCGTDQTEHRDVIPGA